jgi:hypothetical protein
MALKTRNHILRTRRDLFYSNVIVKLGAPMLFCSPPHQISRVGAAPRHQCPHVIDVAIPHRLLATKRYKHTQFTRANRLLSNLCLQNESLRHRPNLREKAPDLLLLRKRRSSFKASAIVVLKSVRNSKRRHNLQTNENRRINNEKRRKNGEQNSEKMRIERKDFA